MRRVAGARTLHHRPGEALVSLDALEGLSAGWVLPGHGDAWTGGLPEALRLMIRVNPGQTRGLTKNRPTPPDAAQERKARPCRPQPAAFHIHVRGRGRSG
jgi:hypothetical protein